MIRLLDSLARKNNRARLSFVDVGAPEIRARLSFLNALIVFVDSDVKTVKTEPGSREN